MPTWTFLASGHTFSAPSTPTHLRVAVFLRAKGHASGSISPATQPQKNRTWEETTHWSKGQVITSFYSLSTSIFIPNHLCVGLAPLRLWEACLHRLGPQVLAPCMGMNPPFPRHACSEPPGISQEVSLSPPAPSSPCQWNGRECVMASNINWNSYHDIYVPCFML